MPVHVLFLDVQMPELDGFAVISALVDAAETADLPVVVFVTAHDEYALRAFEAHAIDYLLKPFSDERFQATLDRAIRHVKAGHAHALMSQMQALLGGDRRRRVPTTCITQDRARSRRSIGSSSRARIACGCCRSSRSAGSKPTACT